MLRMLAEQLSVLEWGQTAKLADYSMPGGPSPTSPLPCLLGCLAARSDCHQDGHDRRTERLRVWDVMEGRSRSGDSLRG